MNHELGQPPEQDGSETGVKRSPVPTGRLRTFEQAQTYLATSSWKLRQLVTQGKLRVVMLDDAEGSKWRFDIHDLDALINACKKNL